MRSLTYTHYTGEGERVEGTPMSFEVPALEVPELPQLYEQAIAIDETLRRAMGAGPNTTPGAVPPLPTRSAKERYPSLSIRHAVESGNPSPRKGMTSDTLQPVGCTAPVGERDGSMQATDPSMSALSCLAQPVLGRRVLL
jgi:hypothetical protein